MSDTIEKVKSQLNKEISHLLNEKDPAIISTAFEFVCLAYIDKALFSSIEKTLSVPKKTLSEWNLKLEPVWRKITDVRAIHKRKGMAIENFWEFYDWYLNSDRKCKYCKITEDEIKQLNLIVENKRKTRGATMEIDRAISSEKYDNIKNLTWSCYWCNNAKTDTFTSEEFIHIGEAIGKVWKKRLNK